MVGCRGIVNSHRNNNQKSYNERKSSIDSTNEIARGNNF